MLAPLNSFSSSPAAATFSLALDTLHASDALSILASFDECETCDCEKLCKKKREKKKQITASIGHREDATSASSDKLFMTEYLSHFVFLSFFLSFLLSQLVSDAFNLCDNSLTDGPLSSFSSLSSLPLSVSHPGSVSDCHSVTKFITNEKRGCFTTLGALYLSRSYSSNEINLFHCFLPCLSGVSSSSCCLCQCFPLPRSPVRLLFHLLLLMMAIIIMILVFPASKKRECNCHPLRQLHLSFSLTCPRAVILIDAQWELNLTHSLFLYYNWPSNQKSLQLAQANYSLSCLLFLSLPLCHSFPRLFASSSSCCLTHTWARE